MRKQGEITVFLSLILICVLSLFLGLLESARTAGARLYLEMATNSSMASVMSQYNRNLWDEYHLLFLEAESDHAVEESFASYLGFYLEQENLYPMKINEVNVVEKVTMAEAGGRALEQEVLSYVGYRLPDVAANLSGIGEMAGAAGTVGDFKYLFDVCRAAGEKTRKLEVSRKKVENALEEMDELRSSLEDAVYEEDEERFEKKAEQLIKKIGKFPGLVKNYEEEVIKISEHLSALEMGQNGGIADAAAGANLEQEILMYRQVADSAEKWLGEYLKMEEVLERSRNLVEKALEGLEEREAFDEPEEDTGPDWSRIQGYVENVVIPDSILNRQVDAETVSALDRLEKIVQGDWLELVLPPDVNVSEKKVALTGIPSIEFGASADEYSERTIVEQFLINEYCFMSFESFLRRQETLKQQVWSSENVDLQSEKQALIYEQEYLLCGKDSDRGNLKGTVDQLIMLRGAMNLLYLLGSAKMKAEADSLAAAVSGGNVPIQFILSFFILTMWAFGEAVLDVRCLLNGQAVAFWKIQDSWKLELEELLSLKFLESTGSESQNMNNPGTDYQDYMRILFLLMDKETRNLRMMDVIQWNIRVMQEDFLVSDCMTDVKMNVAVTERHLFFLQTEYQRTVETIGTY